jgi:tetratricopeptide (TPR) repeat protein
LLPANIANSYLSLRMWKEASRSASRALALDPHNILAMRAVLFSCLYGIGDIEEASRILATFSPDRTLLTSSNFGNCQAIIGAEAYLLVIKRDFIGALRTWETESSDSAATRQNLAARAAIQALAGDNANPQSQIEQARLLVAARLRERPNDKPASTELSWIDLALKRDAEALKLAQQAADSTPLEKDAVTGPLLLSGLAEIEARTGRTNEAVATLHRLLSVPAGNFVSIKRLEIDPIWDPIRSDPGFQQLLLGTQQIGPAK